MFQFVSKNNYLHQINSINHVFKEELPDETFQQILSMSGFQAQSLVLELQS